MISFIDNLILGIALTLPLGPVTLEILRRGLKYGFSESIKAVIGSFSAELTYFTITYLGLAGFSGNSFIKISLGSFGAAFLLYLGYNNLKDFINETGNVGKKEIYRNSFISGYCVTFLNPLNFFMWAGIIGGFFAQNLSLFASSGVLFGILLSLLLIALISWFGRGLLHNGMRYFSLIAGLFLAFYGIRLLYQLIF